MSVAAAALTVGLAAPVQVFAAVDESFGDNAIIVTAIKRETTLQDTPVAVSVTSAETIERAHIRDLKDLQSVVPSLRVNQLQSSANTNFYIRGFGNGANNAGIESSVGLFVDGVYRSRAASMIADFPDVERIEVLRGPQSTLFGKNASAGVISIITKKPQFDFGGNIEASYGNHNAVVLKGVVTGPISDTIAASIAAGYNMRDGIVRDLATGQRTNERDRWFARGQLLFNNNDGLEVRLIGDYGEIDENCCAVVNLRQALPTQVIFALGGAVNRPEQAFDNITFYDFESSNRITNWGLSGQIDYDLGAAQLTSITSYRRTDSVTNQDSDFSSADVLGRNFQDLGIKTFTQELRANFEIGDSIQALVGAFYFNEKIGQQNEVFWGNDARPYANLLVQSLTGGALNIGGLNAADLELIFGGLEAVAAGNPFLAGKYVGQFYFPGTGLTEGYQLKDEAYSFFTQVDLELADGLTLTGGINYTHSKKRFATATTSNDVFSGIDLNDPDYAPFRQELLFQGALSTQIGQVLGLGRGASAAEIGAFAGSSAANAAMFSAVSTGSALFAASNANNPAANPLNPLKALQFFPPFMNVPNAVEPGRLSDGDFSFTARLAHEINPNVSAYLAFATGYKAASINLSRDSRPTPADLTTLRTRGLAVTNLISGGRFADAEDATVYEAGIKGNWGNVSANFAIFKQSIKNFQSNLFTGSGFFLANAGKQSAFGVEFDGSVKAFDKLTLTLAMTYLEPKYDSFVLSGVGDLSGTTASGVSPFSMTIGGELVEPLGGGHRLIVRLDYHYEAPFNLVEGLPALIVRDSLNQIVNSDAGIAAAREFRQTINDVNGSITFAMANGFEISVWGRNLLNDRTILQIFDSPAQPGSISGYPNQPRTYGVGARLRF
jgi:outer membrane receptor protein involved in Fe transport